MSESGCLRLDANDFTNEACSLTAVLMKLLHSFLGNREDF